MSEWRCRLFMIHIVGSRLSKALCDLKPLCECEHVARKMSAPAPVNTFYCDEPCFPRVSRDPLLIWGNKQPSYEWRLYFLIGLSGSSQLLATGKAGGCPVAYLVLPFWNGSTGWQTCRVFMERSAACHIKWSLWVLDCEDECLFQLRYQPHVL